MNLVEETSRLLARLGIIIIIMISGRLNSNLHMIKLNLADVVVRVVEAPLLMAEVRVREREFTCEEETICSHKQQSSMASLAVFREIAL